MKIRRGSYDYELTSDELFKAYKEQQHLFDKLDVEDIVVGSSDGSEEGNRLECYLKEHFDEIAYEMRRNIDKYDMSLEAARDDAIKLAKEEFEESEEGSNA